MLRSFIIWLLLMPLGVATAQAKDSKKIYISADMEGLVGAVTEHQLAPGGFEYHQFRQIYTNEVNTAIEAAFKAGATEILVSDSHGNGQGLLPAELNPNVQLVRSWPRPLFMMEGIDDSFDGVIFIGYHSGSDNPDGVRAHTISSTKFTSVKINGTPMTEASFNAAIAGHFGVPVIMVSGDDAIAEEAAALLGDIETAVVKWSLGFHSARTLSPPAAYSVIEEKTKKALQKTGKIEPYRFKGPINLELSLKSRRTAELLSYLPSVERVDSYTIRYTGRNMIDVSKFVVFVLMYRPVFDA
ncbi:M55 family metallopeptidase [Pseudomaricurvus alkylphenolicus]|uniref:M55 family metallopeptidase n=1 Tax=Pseudomaricurvus alkylphenolicus TaxID=1306991 RepID=UPI00142425FF|nr:M55 family metallopeptidase [Pseudomaricurvus alkylphenolicus]NIB38461.1 M55 family metallopeptidase [Pseudomaricurvus alkylphenolicus]